MERILFCLVFAVASGDKDAHFRVINGEEDVFNEFPYVVCLAQTLCGAGGCLAWRECSGTLVSPRWVLTGAHCLHNPHVDRVAYGDMTVPLNETTTKRRILKKIPHPNYKYFLYRMRVVIDKNDIGLVLIEELAMGSLGAVSAVDYRALLGSRVRYAGFGITAHIQIKRGKLVVPVVEEDSRRPLQLGSGVVASCGRTGAGSAVVCVVAACARADQEAHSGDSGGPVLLGGRVVGVINGGGLLLGQTIVTPVSPYLDWMHDVLTSAD